MHPQIHIIRESTDVKPAGQDLSYKLASAMCGHVIGNPKINLTGLRMNTLSHQNLLYK
jgi:hypothetical protein